MKDYLEVGRRFAERGSVGSVERAVARAADDREVPPGVVVGYTPGHDVVHVDTDAIDRSSTAPTTRTVFVLPDAPTGCLPFRTIAPISGNADALGDAGAGSTAFDVTLDRGAAIRTVSLRALGRAATGHTERFVFREHEFSAVRAGRLRRTCPFAAQLIRACPAPLRLAVARLRLARHAQADRPLTLPRCAGRAAFRSPFDGTAAIDAVLLRQSLMGDLARLTAGRSATDRSQAIGADSYTHCTNMIPDWRR